jgi:LCP family protein required for cell wall assembly
LTNSPIVRVDRSRSDRRYQNSGCLSKTLLLGILLALPILMCGVFTLGYLLIPPPSMNILVVGIDSRGNEGAVSRTDSIMIVNVNADRVKLSILSIPRGLWVNVPNYGSQMVNTANFLGEANQGGTGMALLSATIEQNFDIEIDHYVRMDFAGFVDLVDAVGGLQIDVPRVIEDYAYPTADYGTIQVRFEQGPQWMDGERALIYARTRHSDDDYARAQRQQQVLSGFVNRAINPLTWASIVYVLNQSVETDLNVFDLIVTAPTALMSGGHYNQLVIDRDYILPGANGPIPDYAKLNPFITENFQ